MPQPIRAQCTLVFHHELIKERPNHAIGIALVASEWTALETDLIEMFTFALIPSGPWAPSVWTRAPAASTVARHAWEAMESTKARLDFLLAICKGKVPDDLLKEFSTDVVPAIRSRAGERNRIVHGFWNTSPEYPDDLILVSAEGNFRYTVKDFDDIAKRINETVIMFASYWTRVAQRLGAKPLE